MAVELLFRAPAMADLDHAGTLIVGALRRWMAASRLGSCPIAAASHWLGCRRAAAHLHLMLEEIGAAWPDPFAVSPPCCPRLSHDEALLASFLAAAAGGDRPHFDRLLVDLVPDDARERLFLSARVLSQVLRG